MLYPCVVPLVDELGRVHGIRGVIRTKHPDVFGIVGQICSWEWPKKSRATGGCLDLAIEAGGFLGLIQPFSRKANYVSGVKMNVSFIQVLAVLYVGRVELGFIEDVVARFFVA